MWKKEKKQRCGFDRDFQKEKLEFKREVKFLRAIIKFFESNNQIFFREKVEFERKTIILGVRIKIFKSFKSENKKF